MLIKSNLLLSSLLSLQVSLFYIQLKKKKAKKENFPQVFQKKEMQFPVSTDYMAFFLLVFLFSFILDERHVKIDFLWAAHTHTRTHTDCHL